MSKPEIAAKVPCAVDVEQGKDYWWCACGKKQIAALLRRIAPGRIYTGKIHSQRDQKDNTSAHASKPRTPLCATVRISPWIRAQLGQTRHLRGRRSALAAVLMNGRI